MSCPENSAHVNKTTDNAFVNILPPFSYLLPL
jgi:hypothetical protein